jgi:LDH2 family malate/lactate/ureidoglycolate dehydrogenase
VPRVLVSADELRRLCGGILESAGMSEADAATLADSFVWANLRGIDSHGVTRVPRYLELFEKGESDPAAAITCERLRPAALLVDAHQAPGPLALTRAMREAIALARESGVAWAAVRGTVHTGALGYYTTLAAAEGMAGIGIVAGMPNMGYQGVRGAAVATNPLAVALPAARHPSLVLDMASSVIALGKIAQHRAQGLALEPGWAVTAEGEPTTDPEVAKVPLPLGGAKGSGMSLAFELLASGLAGNPIVAPFHCGTPEGRRHRQNATMIAVDVSAFLPLADFERIVDETLDTIKGLPQAGSAAVLFPGERGAQTLAERESSGIPLGEKAWAELTAAAESRGVPVPAPLAA